MVSVRTTIRRPISVSVIGVLFLVAGIVGVAYHAREFTLRGPIQSDVVLVCLVRVLAIVGGVFLLRGHDWARWLLVGWMAFHVVISGFHSVSELIVHAGLLGIIAYWLFRAEALRYFRPEAGEDTAG